MCSSEASFLAVFTLGTLIDEGRQAKVSETTWLTPLNVVHTFGTQRKKSHPLIPHHLDMVSCTEAVEE